MALSDGDDAVLGNRLAFQQYNRLKNHWRGAAIPANAQPGMICSLTGDDKLYHITGSSPGEDEILQALGSFDTTPLFDNLILDVDSAALSDPPTEAELAVVFGSDPGDGFVGFVQATDSGAKMYQVLFFGGTFYYQEMTAAL